MPSFGIQSNNRLEGVHPELRVLARRVVDYVDCSVIYGKRTIEEQRKLVEEGLSKTMNSLHLPQEDGYAHAIDLAPYPIDWDDTKRFYYFAGIVLGMAKEMGINLRWGGDWDKDHDLNDQTFMDLVHFEYHGRLW